MLSLYKTDFSGFEHPCCTNVSRMILKTNREYFHNNNKLGLDRISLHPSSNRKYCQGNDTFLYKAVFRSAGHRRN